MSDVERSATDRVERELVIPAPPRAVWEAITSDGWLAGEVSMDLVPGGAARFCSDGREHGGWVEEATPPGDRGLHGRLAFWWADGDQPASRVELTLEPEGEEATRLRVVEARPLEVLDAVGIPMPGSSRMDSGPVLLAA